MRRCPHSRLLAVSALALHCFLVSPAAAQDLAPGAYTPAPTGFNLLILSANYSTGGLSFDPTLPIDDAHAKLGSAVLGYGRTFGLAGRFSTVVAAFPFVKGHASGVLAGTRQDRELSGMADPVVRFAMNLFGARAMKAPEFAKTRFPTIAGLSLVVSGPWGQYDSNRYLNLGRHRWTVRPEAGFMRTRGAWTVEGDFGVSFFSTNEDFVSGTQHQAPIWTAQGHLTYTIRPGLWVAGDVNYFRGGRLTTNGAAAVNQIDNSRAGITLAVPIGSRQIRVAYSDGARTVLGGDFKSVGMSYTYVWK